MSRGTRKSRKVIKAADAASLAIEISADEAGIQGIIGDLIRKRRRADAAREQAMRYFYGGRWEIPPAKGKKNERHDIRLR